MTAGRHDKVTADDIERLYQAALDRGVDPDELARQRETVLAAVDGDMDRLASAWTLHLMMQEFYDEIARFPRRASDRDLDLRQLGDLIRRYPQEAAEMVRALKKS